LPAATLSSEAEGRLSFGGLMDAFGKVSIGSKWWDSGRHGRLVAVRLDYIAVKQRFGDVSAHHDQRPV
jgi:hypothetical protein